MYLFVSLDTVSRCHDDQVETPRRRKLIDELERLGKVISGVDEQDRYRRRDLPIAKVSPLIAWSWEMVDRYADIHGLPRHPLYGEGYTSIGCAPCTVPTFATLDDRGGRWEGVKMECGLHIKGTDQK